MPKGPNGVKRPADTNSAAVMVGRIATGEIDDTPSKAPNRAAGGKAGGKARAETLPPERRKEISAKGVAARNKVRK
jgi:hypothetical protein